MQEERGREDNGMTYGYEYACPVVARISHRLLRRDVQNHFFIETAGSSLTAGI